ncbi:ribonucleases domain containing protein [Babesia ovata]|uniref:Ribonucleases domain containing protein n=1 Tax=Babesia ovata TaxID=189622 RepID=A0A2H6KIC8_9APIC|nr:ribonucleases domain containing protein [Babesia ovata]GBE62750.1 ribonucleases domain containing protein [Babesia ovata]
MSSSSAGGGAAVPFGGTVPGDIGMLEMVNVKKLLQSRCVEIEELFTALKRGEKQDRVFQRLPFALRRRAMSHNPFRVPKRLRLHLAREMAKSMPKCAKRLRKDVRRRLNRLEEYRTRCERNNWLETHMYHAKRFKMERLWGYRMAVRTTQKCRRRCLRNSMRRCVIHDLSYVLVVSVSGCMPALRRAFKNMFADSSIMFQDRLMQGEYRSQAFAYAKTGDSYHMICPVQFVWITPSATVAVSDTGADYREVWFFVHPASLEEFMETARASDTEVVCRMIKDLCTFEVLGPLSALLLRRTLKADGSLTTGNSQWKQLDPGKCDMPPSYILPLRVMPPVVHGNSRPSFKFESMRSQPFKSQPFMAQAVCANERNHLTTFKKPENFAIVTKVNVPRLRRRNYGQLVSKLLDTLNVRYPYESRPATVDRTDSSASNMDDVVMDAHSDAEHTNVASSQDHVSNIQQPSATSQGACTDGDLASSIPIWLIRRGDAIGGFDVVMPAGTIARKLWILLNRYGALGIGLQEREMLYAQHGQCMFPQDYPETLGGQQLMEAQQAHELPEEWIPKSFVGRMDGSYMQSRHLLLSCITAGLHRVDADVDQSMQILRVNCFPYSASNQYVKHLLDTCVFAEHRKTTPIDQHLLLSCCVKVAGRGSISAGSRIYLPTQADLDRNHQFVGVIVSGNLPAPISRCIGANNTSSRFRPISTPSNARDLKLPEVIKEPPHEEYKLRNLKGFFACSGRRKRVDLETAVAGLRELDRCRRKPLRACIGAVTSRGFSHKGNCVVQMRAFIELMRCSIAPKQSTEANVALLQSLRLFVWLRNNNSADYVAGILSIAVHDNVGSFS